MFHLVTGKVHPVMTAVTRFQVIAVITALFAIVITARSAAATAGSAMRRSVSVAEDNALTARIISVPIVSVSAANAGEYAAGNV